VKSYIKSDKVSDKLCALCNGTGADKCSQDANKNRYAGYRGAFMCMAEGKGDVAFAVHRTVSDVVANGQLGGVTDYQYLCKDGKRRGRYCVKY